MIPKSRILPGIIFFRNPLDSGTGHESLCSYAATPTIMNAGGLQIYRIDSWCLYDTPSRITTMTTMPSTSPLEYHPPFTHGSVPVSSNYRHSIPIVLPLALRLLAPPIHLLGILRLPVSMTTSNVAMSAGHTLSGIIGLMTVRSSTPFRHNLPPDPTSILRCP